MSKAHETGDASHTALGLLWAVSALLADDMDRGLSERGLTRARGALLWRLYHHGSMNQRELSQALEVTPRHITTLVDALQDGEYLTRQEHPTDRRSTQVTLTQQGNRAVTEMNTRAEHAARELFGDIDPASLDAFVGVLTTVTERLQAQADGPPHSPDRDDER